MTREEAILYMTLYRQKLVGSVSDLDKDIEAYDMAIESLKQERSRLAQITQYRNDCEKLMQENEQLKKALKQEPTWIPIKTRPLTNEEKEKYAYLGYSDEELDFMYDCLLPDDGEEVLITTRYDEVETDTFYHDEGCFFESYCDEDDVKAWMPLPEPYKGE